MEDVYEVDVYEVKVKITKEFIEIIELDEPFDSGNSYPYEILKKHYLGSRGEHHSEVGYVSFEVKRSNEKPEKILSTKWLKGELVPIFTNKFTPEESFEDEETFEKWLLEEGISKEQVVGTKTDDLEEDHTPF